MTTRIIVATTLLLAVGSTASADTITITPTRNIFLFAAFTDVSSLGASESDGVTSSRSGIFSERRAVTARTELGSLSVAGSQETNFDPFAHRLTGSGSISAGPNALAGIGEVDRSDAISEALLQFTLTRATPFRFRGVLAATGEATVQATIDGLSAFNEFGVARPVAVSDRGILQPGSYLFFTRAAFGTGIPNITGTASFDIDFSLGAAPTPEPASLTLLAIGVGAVCMERRRRMTTPAR